ncbi:HD domain-containing protein [Aurantimonas sp. A2-1-M11]|uniref:HD domain-containing protein n=1 Tax=Aurantimonas sp. A2-1-M11 TaxID=3113712 RepID=UPI002F952FDD
MTAWAQTVTGRALDFAAPVVEPEHLFTEIAHGLSLIARFAGQTAIAYSVAQHSVLMAEACEDEIDDPLVAAYCLLHDGHEAYLGDTPSPAKAAIEAEMLTAAAEAGVPDQVVEAQIARWRTLRRRIEQRLDTVIHRAAGLPPIDDRARTIVKSYDVRALKTERRDLMARWDPRPWHPSVEQAQPLLLRNGRIRPWPAGIAAERFIIALNRLCPNAALAAGRLAEGDAA